jgi:hypothetical protein
MSVQRRIRGAVVLIAILLGGGSASADVVTPTDDVDQPGHRSGERHLPECPGREPLPGQQLELVGSVPFWYEVRLTPTTTGYVSKRWTRVITTATPPPPPPPEPSFTLDVVDVGTGLGLLLRGQDFTLVYDAGSNDDLARGPGNRFQAYLAAVVPTLTVIDHMVLSHPHRDTSSSCRISSPPTPCARCGTRAGERHLRVSPVPDGGQQ